MPIKKLKKVSGWPDPNGLTRTELVRLAMRLQMILWGGDDGKLNVDKEWSCDEIEAVAEALSAYGLQP